MAKTIDSFRLSRLPAATACTFHRMMLALINETGAETLHVAEMVPRYEELIEQLQGILNRLSAFVSTASYSQSDTRRDRGVGFIKMTVFAARTSLTPEKSAAGKRLALLLGHFKKTKDHERTRATSEVRAMLSILEHPDNAAAVAALHLEPDVEALRQANEAVNQAIDEKVGELIRRQHQITTATPPVLDAINTHYALIMKHVGAWAVVSPTTQVEDFIGRANSIIKQISLTLSRQGSGRRARKSKAGAAAENGGGEEGTQAK